MRKLLPRVFWGLNFYGVQWCGFQIGYFTDWKTE